MTIPPPPACRCGLPFDRTHRCTHCDYPQPLRQVGRWRRTRDCPDGCPRCRAYTLATA